MLAGKFMVLAAGGRVFFSRRSAFSTVPRREKNTGGRAEATAAAGDRPSFSIDPAMACSDWNWRSAAASTG